MADDFASRYVSSRLFPPAMDLIRHVAKSLNVQDSVAEKGIGAILMALRMSVSKETFETLKQSIPNCESMMGRSLMSSGRTAEMAFVTGPKSLRAALAAAVVADTDIPRLGALVTDHLRPIIGAAAIDKFLEGIPALKG